MKIEFEFFFKDSNKYFIFIVSSPISLNKSFLKKEVAKFVKLDNFFEIKEGVSICSLNFLNSSSESKNKKFLTKSKFDKIESSEIQS